MVKTPVKAPQVSALCQKHEGTDQGLLFTLPWEPQTCRDPHHPLWLLRNPEGACVGALKHF